MRPCEITPAIEKGGEAIASLARSLAKLSSWPADLILDNLFIEARKHAMLDGWGPPRAGPRIERPDPTTTLNSSKKDGVTRETRAENQAENTK